jgi:hypothetical protein
MRGNNVMTEHSTTPGMASIATDELVKRFAIRE